MKKEFFNAKSPKFLKELVASSSDFPDNTYLLQFLTQVREEAEKVVAQCDEMLAEFKEAGGVISHEDNKTVFKIDKAQLSIIYDASGDGDYYEISGFRFLSGNAKLITNAAVAVYVKPRYAAVSETGVPTLTAYIENSDSIEGLRQLQTLLRQDASIATAIMQGAVAKQE